VEGGQEKDYGSTAEHYLDLACRHLPALARVIGSFGGLSLSDYVRALAPGKGPGLQPREDLCEVVRGIVAPLLGKDVAVRCVRDLAAHPVVLTANHHGVDFFAQSVQGSLIFALDRIAGLTPLSTVPVFSFGSVPLNNLTYPRGLLVYQVSPAELERMPLKLPLFSDRLKRRMVSVTPPLERPLIRRAEARFRNMVQGGQVSPALSGALGEILEEDYGSASVLTLPGYSPQSVVLNNRIWKRLFSGLTGVPEMVYLEFEEITAGLLAFDLKDPVSLARSVMFDPSLREHALEDLDGVRGCWNREYLLERLATRPADHTRTKSAESCGTLFFWGIDASGRRIPLYLTSGDPDREVLRGTDDHGKPWEWPYSPEAVLEGLSEKRLLPSLFTCFLCLSLARGVLCLGGYFQAEYLPRMQGGVVKALERTGGYRDAARHVEETPTDAYLSGMLSVMTRMEGVGLIPAGPLEIVAAGGLGKEDIQKMGSLTLRNAHLAALFETVPDALPPRLRLPGWKRSLAGDCARLLRERVVVL
jgi:hypothetical protein